MSNTNQKALRRGAIAVLAALFLVFLLGLVAFAVDMGVVLVAKTDLQRAADAAAHAAVLELRQKPSRRDLLSDASQTASQIVSANRVLNEAMTLSVNRGLGNQQSDVAFGHVTFSQVGSPMTFGNPLTYNAVRVRIRRDGKQNNEVPLYFSRVFGRNSVSIEAEATAAVIKNVSGLSIPQGESNLPFLPIVINLAMWESRLAVGPDAYSWNAADSKITRGGDGVRELVLFPNNTGSSGNLGTVSMGPANNNSTSKLAGQIRNGLNQTDLNHHGGKIELDKEGELLLGGDPGLSASIQDDLVAVAGQPRIVGLFSKVTGSGNTSEFTIVKFVAIRIMAVDLHGHDKHVTVQPAPFTFKGVTENGNPVQQTSEFIYSPPVFVK